jgi:hypothetical protein
MIPSNISLQPDETLRGGLLRVVDLPIDSVTDSPPHHLCNAEQIRRGVAYIRLVEQELAEWLEEHGYDSVEQLKGTLSHVKSPNLRRLNELSMFAGSLRRSGNHRLFERRQNFPGRTFSLFLID